jgi:hypothetical protein
MALNIAPPLHRTWRSTWDFQSFWMLNAALAIVYLACGMLLLYEQYAEDGTFLFGILMLFPTYICGSRLLFLVYNCQLRPATLLSLATVIWYFAPLTFLTLGIPGYTISADATTLASAAMGLALNLVLASPLLILEARKDRALVAHMEALASSAPNTFVLSFGLLQLALIASGVWTYGSIFLGAARDDGGQLTAILQFVHLIATAMLPVCGFLFGVRIARGSGFLKSLLTYGLPLFSGLIWHFIAGRRYLAVELALTASLYLFGRYGLHGAKLHFFRVGRIVLLVVCVVLVAWPAYFAVRTASYSARTNEMPKITDLLDSADVNEQQMEGAHSQKVIDRAAIIMSYTTVQETLRSFCMGRSLTNSILVSTPPFLVNKKNLYQSTEALWAEHGVPADDYANTVLLESYADFGWMGYILYAGVLSAIIYGMNYFFRSYSLAFVVLNVGLFYALLNAESAMTGYFVTFRNLAAVAVVIAAIEQAKKYLRR